MAFRPLRNAGRTEGFSRGPSALPLTNLESNKKGDHSVSFFAFESLPTANDLPQAPSDHPCEPTGAQPNVHQDAAAAPSGRASTHSGPLHNGDSHPPTRSLGPADCRGPRPPVPVAQCESQPAPGKPQVQASEQAVLPLRFSSWSLQSSRYLIVSGIHLAFRLLLVSTPLFPHLLRGSAHCAAPRCVSFSSLTHTFSTTHHFLGMSQIAQSMQARGINPPQSLEPANSSPQCNLPAKTKRDAPGPPFSYNRGSSYRQCPSINTHSPWRCTQ